MLNTHESEPSDDVIFAGTSVDFRTLSFSDTTSQVSSQADTEKIDAMLAHRKASDPKPGPALYALRALAVALSENSAPAGRLIGSKIVHPPAIDVGFAVEAEDGVLVPVAGRVSVADART